MHTGRRVDRVLGLVRVAGLLVLLGGLGWLTVALVLQGVDQAGRWHPASRAALAGARHRASSAMRGLGEPGVGEAAE
jgi:hypothetical protein